MRIPVHIIWERRRREDRLRRKRREDLARIPVDSPRSPDGPKGRVEEPKGENKKPVVITIAF
jgi:hypothetical protein